MNTPALRFAVAALCAIGSGNAAALGFTPLGFLPGDNASSRATGISADGNVVVGFSGSPSTGDHAFRWTRSGGMTDLSNPEAVGIFSFAQGVSGDGNVAVGFGYDSTGIYQAFRWTDAGGMQFLPGLDDSLHRADSASDNGQVIVGTGAGKPIAWIDGGAPIDLTGGNVSDLEGGALGVSSDGQTIVGNYGSNAFVWTQSGGMADLGVPDGATQSQGYAISQTGLVVGSVTIGGKQNAATWSATAGWQNLGVLPGDERSFAFDVSADGNLALGISFKTTGGVVFHAFLWDPTHGMRSLQDALQNDYGLDLTGWSLSYAAEMSLNGEFLTGYGINPNGATEAWVADLIRPVPLPAPLWLFGSAAAMLGAAVSRRRTRPSVA